MINPFCLIFWHDFEPWGEHKRLDNTGIEVYTRECQRCGWEDRKILFDEE